MESVPPQKLRCKLILTIFAEIIRKMKNLILRAITGAIYVVLICFSVLSGGLSYIVFFALITLVALQEFYNLCNSSNGGENITTLVIDVAGGLVLCIGLGCVNLKLLSPFTTAVLGGTFFTVYLLYLIVRLVVQLYSNENSPLTNLAYSYMGQMYVALPLGIMSMFYTFPDGKFLLLAMFVMIWLNDTGAFCVGSLIGKHKLFPRISPKKSWEGFIGGVVFSIASAFVFKFGFPQYFESISLLGLCGLGAVVGAFATWGDLAESLIKRTLGVKDSGNILPGHGGILDRIDSLLLVVPASVLYLTAIILYGY
ncbi:phosphatidate cytidylyltransferase [Duncaniella sp.]|uniref:phosphatidate cytidylyltransferase n=1 Tax=Duncaniella sp. TaxID=2518496 RepID=UPI002606AB8C|nr:phosphatidate cytidylyltransferase [Duncaniella sp.]